MIDTYGGFTFVELLANQQITATGNSTGVDCLPYIGRGAAILNVKNVSGTSPTLAVIIQDSPDNSTWATFASFSARTTENNKSVISIDFDEADRYLRVQYTLGGTTPVYYFGVIVSAKKQIS